MVNSRHLQLAADFCELVDASDLLTYLDITGVDAAEARAKLKSKRRYMQGMQSNPKYRKQALFLIKNFAAFESIVEAPAGHLADMAQRVENLQLPILEMMIQGVLAGGPLKPEQIEVLKKNAAELGVSETTFLETLERLGGPPEITEPQLHPPRLSTMEPLASNATAKAPTGPPARDRHFVPAEGVGAATAPPVRSRSALPEEPIKGIGDAPRRSRLEILGEPVREIILASRPEKDRIVIRNGGSGPMVGRVSTDEPWLEARPVELDPQREEQTIVVRLNPAEIRGRRASGIVTIQTEQGDSASIVYDARKAFNAVPWIVAILGLGGIALVVLLLLLGFALFRASSDPPPKRAPLELQIDPAITSGLYL